MRILNIFCLNLSNIDYLYASDENSIFKSNSKEVGNLINKLHELNLEETLNRLKEAFPKYNKIYDILIRKPKINGFDNF